MSVELDGFQVERALVFDWRNVSEFRVPATAVVEACDVVEHGVGKFDTYDPALAVQQFVLH